MKATLKITTSRAMGLTAGTTRGSSLASGSPTKWKEKAFSSGKMDALTKEATRTTKNTGKTQEYSGNALVWNSFGVFTWPDGRRFEGYWKEGKQHGSGAYYAVNGEKREGEWSDGRRLKWIGDL
jgi:MORN repeat